MATLKENITELYKIINEDNFNRELAIEFLDAISKDTDELEEELTDAMDSIKKLEENIRDLENSSDELEENWTGDGDTEIIETPLGKVFVLNENGNLKLDDQIDVLKKLLKAV